MLIATAASIRAADEPPPIEQIKGDLKAVKPGAMAELPAPPAGPALSVPGFVPPAGDSPPPPPSDSTEKKRPADPDWLLHAMEAQPKGRTGQPRRANQADAHPADPDPHDQGSPDFMLKVYREQELRDRERRDDSASRTDLSLSSRGDVGPFSDLLKHWISPRDLTLFGLEPGPPSADAGALALPAALSVPAQAEVTVTPRGPNPFLDAIQPEVNTVVPPPSGGPAVAPPEAGAPGPLPAVAPPAPQMNAAPPPAHSADDKKYFPQLNRF
jgi:hypothetical protein